MKKSSTKARLKRAIDKTRVKRLPLKIIPQAQAFKPIKRLRFYAACLPGTESTLKSVAKKFDVKLTVFDRDDKSLSAAIEKSDLLLICGAYPLPVEIGQTPHSNRSRVAHNHALKFNRVVYYIGEPYTKELIGRVTPEAVGGTLKRIFPRHAALRYKAKRVRQIHKRGLRVCIVGTPSKPGAKGYTKATKRARIFFTRLMRGFRSKKEPQELRA